MRVYLMLCWQVRIRYRKVEQWIVVVQLSSPSPISSNFYWNERRLPSSYSGWKADESRNRHCHDQDRQKEGKVGVLPVNSLGWWSFALFPLFNCAHQKVPFIFRYSTYTQPALLQHLHVLQLSSLGSIFSQLLEGDWLFELAAELDMYNAPLRIGRVTIFGVMIRGFRVLSGYWQYR